MLWYWNIFNGPPVICPEFGIFVHFAFVIQQNHTEDDRHLHSDTKMSISQEHIIIQVEDENTMDIENEEETEDPEEAIQIQTS